MGNRAKTGIGVAALAAAIGLTAWILLRAGPAEVARIPIGDLPAAPIVETRPAPAIRDGATPIRPRVLDPRSDSEPPAIEAPSGNAAVTVHVIWGDDKKPAAAVSVRVVEWGAETGTPTKTRDLMTADDGTIRMTDLIPGPVTFYVDRGGVGGTDVARGTDPDVTIEIPPGPTVAGRVVDRENKPIAGADIWLSQAGWKADGAVVSHSDAKGEFVLRCVSLWRSVAARARGHIASDPYQIAIGRPGETVTVEIRLGGPGASVGGVVKTSDGAPVAGARVRVLSPEISTDTDAAGIFVIESLPPGKRSIAVRAAGLAPWSGSVEVQAGIGTPIEVRLVREAVIAGTVKLSSGKPASRASVEVGPIGEFLSSRTRTDAEGSFRLGGLAPGTIGIVATARGAGEASATLACAEAAEVRWDAVIDAGLRIVGVVRDDHEQPLSGWIVQATAERLEGASGWDGRAMTDADGRFSIVSCPPRRTFSIAVTDKKARSNGGRPVFINVTPSESDLVIHASVKALAAIKGRIVGADGRPVAASIAMSSGNCYATGASKPETGLFSIEPIEPGHWRIAAELKLAGSVDLGDHDIEPGATLDLGDVKLEPMGSLAIDLTGPAAAADHAKYSILPTPVERPGSTPWIIGFEIAHRVLPRPLAIVPGSYTLNLKGSGVVPQWLNFDIAPGKETRLTIAAEVGVTCEFRFTFPEGEKPTDVGYAFEPIGGGVKRNGSAMSREGSTAPLVGTSVVPPGSYRVTAWASSGRHAEKEFTVSLDAPAPTIDVELKAPKSE